MRRDRHTGSRSLFSIAGWLFSDLLLALAVIFISANTIGAKPIKAVKPTPTLPVTVTPQVTPQVTPILELHYSRFILQINNPDKFLQNDNNEIKQFRQQVMGERKLQGRLAGLVVAYGGAPTTDQIPNAILIAKKVIAVLQSLEHDDNYLVFSNTSYYDPLYILGGKATTATIDVYLFAK